MRPDFACFRNRCKIGLQFFHFHNAITVASQDDVPVFGLSFKRALDYKMNVIHFVSDDYGIIGVFPRGLQRNVWIVHFAQEFRDVEADVVVDAIERIGTCLGKLVAVQLNFFPIKDDFFIIAAYRVEKFGALPCLEHFFGYLVVFNEIEAVFGPAYFLPVDAENGFRVVDF